MVNRESFLRVARSAALLLCAGASGGCATRLHAIHARYLEPDYVVTKEFFAEAPQRIAVLPFTSSNGDDSDAGERADLCRRTFYQQVAVRDYETPSLNAFDVAVLGTNRQEHAGAFSLVARAIRTMDVLGMTTVLDLNSFTGGETIPQLEFRDLIEDARLNAKADACCVGVTRKYGRLYAVLFSSVGISTRVEMWSAKTGRLLWGAEMRDRNIKSALALNPLVVPLKLYDVWENARGHSLGALAYEVYGHICGTMPYVRQQGGVLVEITREGAPVFDSRTFWMLRHNGRAAIGTRMEFIREQNGWFQCWRDDGRSVWVFRDFARLVDRSGAPVRPRADLHPGH